MLKQSDIDDIFPDMAIFVYKCQELLIDRAKSCILTDQEISLLQAASDISDKMTV